MSRAIMNWRVFSATEKFVLFAWFSVRTDTHRTMQTPFETPYTVLHNGTVGRHTRMLRPYVEQLRSQNNNQPVHANPLNRYVSKHNHVQEDTLEYWISSDDEHDENDSLDGSDSDSGPDADVGSSRKPANKKNRKRRRGGGRGRKTSKSTSAKSKTARTRDSQIITPACGADYEFDSNEIKHLKQQMYLSLESRAKSKFKSKLPYSSSTKDIKLAMISLSGLEPSIPDEHFLAANVAMDNISFLKYSSKLIDNLFFISIYKQNWNLSYKIFRLFINTYNCDVLQIWSLGVHILKQLNLDHFKESLEKEWSKSNSGSALPNFLIQILEDLSFLQNPKLLASVFKVEDQETARILTRVIVQRKPFQNTIFKFIRLLMRTSGIQHPLSGAFPEQNYVPDGIIESDKYTETEVETEAETGASDKSSSSEDGSANDSDDSDSYNNHNSEPEGSSDSAYPNTSDESSSSESETEEVEESTQSLSLSISRKPLKLKQKPITIKNEDFNPNSDTRLPHQQTYIKALHKHSTPTHRHGTRIRTPSYTLTYLWLLLRTGKYNSIQREIEPLLHVVPTSTDGRVGLADLMSRILDLVSIVNDFKGNKTNDFEKIELIKLKLDELIDNWNRWRDQFTSSKNNTYKRDVKQYIDYESIEQSIKNIGIIVHDCINTSTNNSNDKSSNNDYSGNHDDSTDSPETSETFVTADEQELIFEEEQDDEETRKEMDRLLGYSQQEPDEQEEEDDEEDEEEDDEVRLEMERLMGYSQQEDAQIPNYDENTEQQEEEQFFNEYQEASQNNDNNYSDSE